MFWIAALAVVVGCGKTHSPIVPEIQPGPPPVAQSPLKALRGDYRLVEVDGDAVVSGTLSVEDGDDGFGIRYRATASGTTYERRVLTPQNKTDFSTENEHLHQKYEDDGHKITLDYELKEGALSVEVTECRPGVCVVTILSARANP